MLILIHFEPPVRHLSSFGNVNEFPQEYMDYGRFETFKMEGLLTGRQGGSIKAIIRWPD
jgi:hypothetical protein